jgi:hypothetical protein
MNQNKTIDAVDPIGLSLPEEREVWSNSIGAKFRFSQLGLPAVPPGEFWSVCTSTEPECWRRAAILGSACEPFACTITEAIECTRIAGRTGVRVITYDTEMQKWLILREYRIKP